jgi:hypothetical protein
MELRLEGLVETLLVGAMVSLLVLSFIFFAFGHIWNVPVMRRFLDTLFGERPTSPESESDDRSLSVPQSIPEGYGDSSRSMETDRSGRRQRREGGWDGHLKFAPILLLALMYGLGIIAETGSHHFTHEDNKDQKHASFRAVAFGRLKSGAASPRLARFISDYNACHTLEVPRPSHVDSPSLCQQIDDRVLEFFYNAKNVVFQFRQYYSELSVLEARINFMRSFEWLCLLLLFELGAVFVVAFVAEYGKRNHPGTWMRWMTFLFGSNDNAGDARSSLRREWKRGAIELGDHWVKIAAFHVLLLVGASAGLYYLSHVASAYSEDQFAKRVFGYYLALAPEKADSDEEDEDGEKRAVPADVTPESPYHMFSLPREVRARREGAPLAQVSGPHGGSESSGPRREDSDTQHGHQKQRRLEPSAVQILGGTSQVLVASDQGGAEPFWLFTLNEDGTRLENPRPIAVDPSDRDKLGKGTIESLAAFESTDQDVGVAANPCAHDSDHKTFRIFAGPSSFGKMGSGGAHLLSFCLRIDNALKLENVESEELPSPCKTLFGKEECDVEGIAFRMGADKRPELLLGIQRAGASSTLAIVRLQRKKDTPGDGNEAWEQPEKIFPAEDSQCSIDSKIKEMLSAGGGISDLASSQSSGRIYVTTSNYFAVDRQRGHAGQEKGLVSGVPPVGGALWLVDLGCNNNKKGDPCACSEQRATKLETFIHKPDGVTDDNGSALVVFDDEARWKSRQWAPKTFPLGQNEAVFAVVPSPEFK